PLCLNHRTIMNWLEQLQKEGPGSFFRPRCSKNISVMKPEKIAECESLFREGETIPNVAKFVDIKESTLRKAIKRGAISKTPEGKGEIKKLDVSTTKAERSRADADAAAGMGTACVRVEDRVMAAIGLAESATTHFEQSCDVAMGGLLAGLPALCANGLLSGIGKFYQLPGGFYSCIHILLTMAFMALGRIRRPEGLRHLPPGEFGKVIGLDRVPEVRTLREKITLMANNGNPEAWMKELSKTWMEEDPDEAGYLYVDGHIRVYHGSKAKLPRRFVSRERLCLRGTTDYWVNDAVGRPFFVVSKAVTDGLADTLLKDIVPDLLKSVPEQPTAQQLDADPLLHRFAIVFDREGANHSLLSALWKDRIGAITYRKNAKDEWPVSEFTEHKVDVPGGGNTKMKLAVRETTLTAGKATIPVTEVRRLTDTGHQTAVITTARRLGTTVIAGRMFSRWCQENFFAYMMKHYDIDGLVQYGIESLPGTTFVVNPAWRSLDKAVKTSLQGVRKLQAKLGAEEGMDGGVDEGVVIQKKADLFQKIQTAQENREKLLAERKITPKKVTLDSLPEEQRPTRLLPLNKQLADTVKMIAYRAETALVAILRRHLKKEDEARALVRELFVSAADIEPDNIAKTLTIRIHRMASPAHDLAISALLAELSEQKFCHPETGALMVFVLV
ncbi:MAG: hypothetical protein Q8O06_01295, partial [Acetobacterium sp.]|nr:hypothetical protein [Acetobacterium sp.]